MNSANESRKTTTFMSSTLAWLPRRLEDSRDGPSERADDRNRDGEQRDEVRTEVQAVRTADVGADRDRGTAASASAAVFIRVARPEAVSNEGDGDQLRAVDGLLLAVRELDAAVGHARRA